MKDGKRLAGFLGKTVKRGVVYVGQKAAYEVEKEIDPEKAKIRRQGQLNRFRKSQGVTVRTPRKKKKRNMKSMKYSKQGYNIYFR